MQSERLLYVCWLSDTWVDTRTKETYFLWLGDLGILPPSMTERLISTCTTQRMVQPFGSCALATPTQSCDTYSRRQLQVIKWKRMCPNVTGFASFVPCIVVGTASAPRICTSRRSQAPKKKGKKKTASYRPCSPFRRYQKCPTTISSSLFSRMFHYLSLLPSSRHIHRLYHTAKCCHTNDTSLNDFS